MWPVGHQLSIPGIDVGHTCIDWKPCLLYEHSCMTYVSFSFLRNPKTKTSSEHLMLLVILNSSVQPGLFHYSWRMYLSVQSQSAARPFKYWKDFTSYNSRVCPQLHKLTGQCMTHIQVVSALSYNQQRRISLHAPVSLWGQWKANNVRATLQIHLPRRVSLLGQFKQK